MQEYNPPLPENIVCLLEDVVQFANTEDETDILIKAALIYYQFETIHPFENGNGFVGRLLPDFVLMEKGILSRPVLSLSNYLYQNEEECATQFMRNQYFGSYMDWIKFFVRGVIFLAKRVITQLDAARLLRIEIMGKLNQCEKSTDILKSIYSYIEENVILTVHQIASSQKVSYNTALKYVKILEEKGILQKIKEQSRYRVFSCDRYVKIFDTHSGGT